MELKRGFPGSIYWKAKAREVICNLMVLKLFDRHFIPLGHIVVSSDPSDMPWNLIIAKGVTVVKSDKSPESIKVGYISESLWTCACKTNFIRSKLYVACPKCNVRLVDSTERLNKLSSVLVWESFIIDAATYKLDENDRNY